MAEENLEQQAQGGEEQSQEQQGFDFSSINEQYKDLIGENPLDESSFTSLLEGRSKIGEFEQKLADKDQELQGAMEYKTKYESILDNYNPEKLTPNKEVLAISQLSEQHKGADIGVLSKIRSTDLSQLDPLDGLILANKLKVPSNVSDSVRKEVILKGLGIEDVDELTDTDRFRIQTAFANEKGTLDSIKGYEPEGVGFDFEAESKAYKDQQAQSVQKLTDNNKKALDILLDGYKETSMTIKDDKGKDVQLKYMVDEGFKQQFIDSSLESLSKQGVKITNENASEIMSIIDREFKIHNMDNMVQDFIKQMTGKLKEDVHNENHNDSASNSNEAPQGGAKEFKTLKEQFSFSKNR